MLRIADNISDYSVYQLRLSKDKKVERVNLDKLDVRLEYNANNTKGSDKHDKQMGNFQETFQEELEKYR